MSEPSCTTYDPDIFFASTYAELRYALEACQRCPMTDACLKLRGDAVGVWGGKIFETPGVWTAPSSDTKFW